MKNIQLFLKKMLNSFKDINKCELFTEKYSNKTYNEEDIN